MLLSSGAWKPIDRVRTISLRQGCNEIIATCIGFPNELRCLLNESHSVSDQSVLLHLDWKKANLIKIQIDQTLTSEHDWPALFCVSALRSQGSPRNFSSINSRVSRRRLKIIINNLILDKNLLKNVIKLFFHFQTRAVCEVRNIISVHSPILNGNFSFLAINF